MRYIAHNFIINPAFWLFAFLVVTAVLCWRERRVLSIIGIGICLFLFKPPVEWLVVRMEQQHRPLIAREIPPGTPILVLGAGGVPDQRFSPTHWLSKGNRPRVLEGIRLWRQGRGSLLVMSSAGKEGYMSQAEIYAEAARELGVPDSVLRVISTPRTTWEEAKHFREQFPRVGELVLVTSATHMARARRIFEKNELTVIPAPCDFKIKRHPSGEKPISRYVPSLQALEHWHTLLHEYAGWATMGF
ncbi:YdcF family protein [Pleomorphovibrio marinus]|uniref:YdcF family protein n=1 Tax=Pleomorphovibrio marinus TaxID=2164132 RepID=UPI000E0A1866|nr:YdcF family protein [Pleomorphovibrio marinus]